MANYAILCRTASLVLDNASMSYQEKYNMLKELFKEFEDCKDVESGCFLNKPEVKHSFSKNTLAKNRMNLDQELIARLGMSETAVIKLHLDDYDIHNMDDLCNYFDDPRNWNAPILSYEPVTYSSVQRDRLTALHGIYLDANCDCGVGAKELLMRFCSECIPSGANYQKRLESWLDYYDIHTLAQLKYETYTKDGFPNGGNGMISLNAVENITKKVKETYTND